MTAGGRFDAPSDDRDDLDEFLTEVLSEDPSFAEGLADVEERQYALRCLVSRRRQLGLTQTAVARSMGTTQSAVSELEGGDGDLYLSTLQRYARAVGARLSVQAVGVGLGLSPGLSPAAAERQRTSAAVYALPYGSQRKGVKPSVENWQTHLRVVQSA